MKRSSRFGPISLRTIALIAILLAAGLLLLKWPVVKTTRQTALFVPLQIGEIAPGLTVDGTMPKGIEVQVSGPAERIASLPRADLRYRIDIDGTQPGPRTVVIDPEKLTLPRNVRLIKVAPTEIRIQVEKEIDKVVPIILRLTGKPETGFDVLRTTLSPAEIRLRGPQSVLGPLVEIETKPIDITALNESVRREVALDLPETARPVETLKYSADIEILEQIKTATLSGLTVAGRGSRLPFSVTPATIDIRVKGPASVIAGLQESDEIEIYVALDGLKPGVFVRRAVIKLPLNVTLVGATPEIFTCRVGKGSEDAAGD